MLISRKLIVELFNLMVNKAVKYNRSYITMETSLISNITNYSILMVSIYVASFKEYTQTVA